MAVGQKNGGGSSPVHWSVGPLEAARGNVRPGKGSFQVETPSSIGICTEYSVVQSKVVYGT
jgi:hypothetical protein